MNEFMCMKMSRMVQRTGHTSQSLGSPECQPEYFSLNSDCTLEENFWSANAKHENVVSSGLFELQWSQNLLRPLQTGVQVDHQRPYFALADQNFFF